MRAFTPLLWLLLAVGPAAADPRHVLEAGSLRVEVMDPAAPDRYNCGVRFSPVAAVLRATCDGREFFYNPAARDPLRDHGGLAMEFDLMPEFNPPPGFTEAGEGEGFVKIGVGVLKKTGTSYQFWTLYEPLALAETRVEWSAASAKFRQDCPGANGYAYTLEAEVSVRPDRTLQVLYRLTNSGSKPFRTEHYAHNFLRFGEHDIGPDYEIRFAGSFTATMEKPVIEQRGDRLGFRAAITPEIVAAQAKLTRAGEAATVVHLPSGQSLECLVTPATTRFTLHATPTYLSPEQFLLLEVAPGKTAEWTRLYRFNPGN